MSDERGIAERYRLLRGELDERRRRLWAAAEARSYGRGGVAAVVRATDISKNTVERGLRELEAELGEVGSGRVRRAGGGRRSRVEEDPTLLEDLERLVDPDTRGDPESPLRWTSKSGAKLAGALVRMGHEVSDRTVLKLLKNPLGYRLQANRKTREGSDHSDRDEQFRYINETVKTQLAAGEPVISVDTKKRELVGDFKATGVEFEPTGKPVEVRTHDFKDKQLGHAIPYGVLDLAANAGWVSVGLSNDTSEFAVQSIRSWWQHLGRERYPNATSLTITADSGGSNGHRPRLWKTCLQHLADETGLQIHVRHLPPGTSKWNRIEHHLFSFISQNWRGKPLLSHQVIISLIASTTTSTGLKVYARLDPGTYPKGIKVTDQQLNAVNLKRDEFHPDWNYTISPSTDTVIDS